MSGYVNRDNSTLSGNIFSKLKGNLRKFAETGMKYEQKIIKNKMGVGINEQNFVDNGDSTAVYAASLKDISPKSNYTAYDEKDYFTRREYLRSVSLHSDLDQILDIISDESIIMDDQNYFARPNLKAIDGKDQDENKMLREAIQDCFEDIYCNVFEFNNSTVAWNYFRQFLVDGYLAFELIYNEKNDRIIKAMPLDVATIKPDVYFNGNTPIRVWVQNPNDEKMRRVIFDTNIIYISYTKDGFTSRISYIERLIRTFNLKRVIETTTVLWFIMNSTFRLKVIVPVSQSVQKNEEVLGKMASKFKEEVRIDDVSGQVEIDGQVGLNLYRNYMLASKDGQQTEMESMKLEGPDLSSPEILKYWENKLKKESRIPFSRFDSENSTEINIGKDATGMNVEEFRFKNFITRLRSDFQDILIKPLILQLKLKHKEFRSNSEYVNKVGIEFVENNMFVQARKMEFMKSKLEFIKSMNEIEDDLVEGKKYFPMGFLVQKYLDLDQDYINELEAYKEKSNKDKAEGEEGEEGGDISGGEFESPSTEEPTSEEPTSEEPTSEEPTSEESNVEPEF